MDGRLKTAVILIMTVVWAFNIIVPTFVKDYKSVPELNSAFMGLVGIILMAPKKENGGGDSEPPDELRARRAARQPQNQSEDEGSA